MTSHPFPADLLEAQTHWYRTYAELAAEAQSTGSAAQRRRLLQLSRRIASHPYWESPAGTPAARVALKELARTGALGENS
ncbi:hypothetical protein [Streptomyces sp. NBC_01465]|uniref:hypothetical protein n=1 Tax=Streptomyces sp. NBC_01465 TaxID=2903878 RepID=UPI002E31E8BF|nr:hypothetical protein [Streptomyces sp. NBC_01465]